MTETKSLEVRELGEILKFVLKLFFSDLSLPFRKLGEGLQPDQWSAH